MSTSLAERGVLQVMPQMRDLSLSGLGLWKWAYGNGPLHTFARAGTYRERNGYGYDIVKLEFYLNEFLF